MPLIFSQNTKKPFTFFLSTKNTFTQIEAFLAYNLLGQFIQDSMENLKIIAQKMAELPLEIRQKIKDEKVWKN